MWQVTNLKETIMRILVAIILIVVPFVVTCIANTIISRFDKGGLKIPPRYDGKHPPNILQTWNGIGFSFYGKFRGDLKTSSYARYLCFCIFSVPIIPIGCYRVEYGEFQRISHKQEVQNYKVYGSEKWRFWECVSIYLLGITIVFALIGVIKLLEALF